MDKLNDGSIKVSAAEVARGARVLFCDCQETQSLFIQAIRLNTCYRTLLRIYNQKTLKPEQIAEFYQKYKELSAEYKGILKQIKKHVTVAGDLVKKYSGGGKSAPDLPNSPKGANQNKKAKAVL